MKYKIVNRISYLVFLIALTIGACKKEKMEMGQDNRVTTENRGTSQVRIFNFGEYNQVIVGKDSLTNFTVLNPNTLDYYKYPGTSYFPKNGRLGKVWNVPQDLFDAQNNLKLKISTRNYQGLGDRDLNLSVANTYDLYTDYFLFPSDMIKGISDVAKVTRNVSSPSKPDHFKIRVVNLGAKITETVWSPYGIREDLDGEVSLAYADGTLVNEATTKIGGQTIASDYIELPYGTYQFKLLLNDGRQVPAYGEEVYNYRRIDPVTSTIPVNFNQTTHLHYAPIRTFQPGGVYTLVIVPQRFEYIVDELDNSADLFQNAVQLITDIEPEANRTFFRAQSVNAYQQDGVSFSLGGKTFVENLAFGEAGGYFTQVYGSYTIEAKDAFGKVLATTQQSLRAAQNYTFWLYPGNDGKATILTVANDLSGTVPRQAQDDATFSRYENSFFFFKRFLNLSVGNPYITFTLSNGQGAGNSYDNAEAAQNLQPGVAKLNQPYLLMGETANPFAILAYRSTPAMLPGYWANDIPILANDAFVARKELYQRPGRATPVQEAGLYTVALIGNSNATAPSTTKAKMVVVKHNK